jgi:hypothetical protein
MRAERIIEGGTEPRVLASPLAALMTERILAEWEIARDAVMFPEERVELCRIVQATLDEQKHLLSLATGQKNEEMTAYWRAMAWFYIALAALAVILWAVTR